MGGCRSCGLVELSALLAESPTAQTCMVEMFLTHSTATTEVDCLTGWLSQDGSLSMEEMLLGLVGTEAFVLRTGGSDEGDVLLGAPGDDPPALDEDIDVAEEPNEDLEVVVEQEDWSTGYCQDVTVTNLGAADIEWAVPLTVPGPISSAWGAVYTATEGEVWFSGVDWNAVLVPGDSTGFGFCGEF